MPTNSNLQQLQASKNSALESARLLGVTSDSVETTIEKWSNISRNYSVYELTNYADQFYHYMYAQQQWSLAQNVVVMFLAITGVLGYAIEAIVLKQKEFNCPSFLYHKSLVGFELCNMLCIIIEGVEGMFVPSRSLAFRKETPRFVVIINAIGNSCGMAAAFITFFICAERLVAIYFSEKFHLINTNNMATIFIGVSVACGTHYLVDVFKPELAASDAYSYYREYRDALELIECFILAILSIFIVIGLLQNSKRQQNVRTPFGESATSLARLNRQLALLSLSCAVPLFVAISLWQYSEHVCRSWKGWLGCFVGDNGVALDYEIALAQLRKARIYAINTFFVNLFYMIAHATHFYQYFLLSSRFKQATIRLFFNRISRISFLDIEGLPLEALRAAALRRNKSRERVIAEILLLQARLQ